jgi:hypothetical protein
MGTSVGYEIVTEIYGETVCMVVTVSLCTKPKTAPFPRLLPENTGAKQPKIKNRFGGGGVLI